VTLTFDLESGVRVTCDVAYLCANLVFLSLSVLDLGPMYATDRQTSDVRQTDVRQHHRLMPRVEGGDITIIYAVIITVNLNIRSTPRYYKQFY